MKPINKYLVNRRLTTQDNKRQLTVKEVKSYLREVYADRCKKVTIRYEHGDPIVDIEGDFYLRKDVEEIPFQFGKVTNNFNCGACLNLTSLVGCPQIVGGNFNCTRCKNLTSLEGCPKEVGSDFYCVDCSKQFTEEEVRSLCDVKRNIFNK